MNIIKKLLPHVCIILAGMYITFYVIDQYNTAMGYMNDPKTKILTFFLSVVAIVVSAMLIYKQRREG